MTKIEWTHIPGTVPRVWNPVTGCSKVSAGCKNCYAEIMHRRLQAMRQEKYKYSFNTVVMHEDVLELPKTWKKASTIFVNSMSDLFHYKVSFMFIRHVFEVMRQCMQHTFIVLTKRPEQLKAFIEWMSDDTGMVYYTPRNVVIGVTCENQEQANYRIPYLYGLQIGGKIVISCEPLLSAIDLSFYLNKNLNIKAIDIIDWVIVGGESGHKSRPMHVDWVRSLRNQCQKENTAFFFKQWGNWNLGTHIDSKLNSVLLISGQHLINDIDLKEATKCTADEWDQLKAIAIHKTKIKSQNLLDGKTHLEFPIGI